LRFGGLVLVFALLAAAAARAETITWVTSAQPVQNSSETQDSGQLAFLTAHLQSFTHHIVRVSTARAYHELEHGSGVCKVGVLLSPERQRYAVFSARHLVLPGYHLVVRKDRLPALAPAIVKGEVDLDKLASLPGLTGGYTHLRHYDDPIAHFTEAHDGVTVTGVVATPLLFNLLLAERMDYAFVLPMDAYYYPDEAARQKLSLLPIKGARSWTDAGVACSSDQSGRDLIQAVDALLADDENWAAFVEPLRKWIPPESYPTLLAGRPSNVDRMP
jgi:uncharacterized protein (TIGR02285 family)